MVFDIHGQHEHQSLLHKRKHMEILDSYCGEAYGEPAAAVAAAYKECRELERKIEEDSMDGQELARQQSLAEFECREIEEAGLIPGEDEELEQRYRRMVNSKRITESLVESYGYTGNEGQEGAGSLLSRALRALRSVTAYDSRLEELEQQLTEVDNLLADYNRDLAEYMSDCEFDEESFRRHKKGFWRHVRFCL